jgi:5'-3' exonuclease
MKKNRVVLIDGMNLAYRVAHVPSFVGLRDSKDNPTGVLHGFLTSLLLFVRSSDEVIIAWDTRSERKRAIYPKYKAKRDEKDPIKVLLDNDLHKQLIPLRKILHLMGFSQYQVEGYEGDEIIGAIAETEKRRVVILSEDKDFLQLVNSNVSIYQPIKKRMITNNNFSEIYYGLTPNEYFEYRAFTGDVSDEIDGIPGCGEKTGLAIIEAIRNNEAINESSNKLLKTMLNKEGNNLRSIAAIVNRNKELMYLGKDNVIGLLEEQKGTLDTERLQIWLDRYELEKVVQLFIERIL